MAAGQKCTACGKGGLFRKGSSECIRCEKRPAATTDPEPVVAVAVVETTAVVVAEVPVADLQLERRRRPKKTYVKMMGRVLALPEDDE